jgi:hypothetical protein
MFILVIGFYRFWRVFSTYHAGDQTILRRTDRLIKFGEHAFEELSIYLSNHQINSRKT